MSNLSEIGLPLILGGTQLVADFLFHKKELLTGRELHQEQIELGHQWHAEELKISRELHEEELRKSRELSQRQHLMETYFEQEMHFAELDSELINATKESERDMFDQRNNQLQTLILASTVMFAGLMTLLVEGGMPTGASEGVTVAFSLVCGLSFAILFVSVIVCIEVLKLASSFMVTKATNVNKLLRQVRRDNQNNFQKLRRKSGIAHMALDDNEVDMSRFRESVVRCSPENLEERWESIEESSHRLLAKRIEINRHFYPTIAGATFEEFWRVECDNWNTTAVSAFFVGTTFMLVGVGIWIYCQFVIVFKSEVAALAGVVPVCLAVPIGLYITISNAWRKGSVEEDVYRAPSYVRDSHVEPLPQHRHFAEEKKEEGGPLDSDTFPRLPSRPPRRHRDSSPPKPSREGRFSIRDSNPITSTQSFSRSHRAVGTGHQHHSSSFDTPAKWQNPTFPPEDVRFQVSIVDDDSDEAEIVAL